MPRRRQITARDLADIRAALDYAQDIAARLTVSPSSSQPASRAELP